VKSSDPLFFSGHLGKSKENQLDVQVRKILFIMNLGKQRNKLMALQDMV